jgi:hypothetical protein
MQQINFSSNSHGKLFLDVFEDIRLADDFKFIAGNTLEVLLKNKSLGYAQVLAVKAFNFNKISDTLAFVNCGHHAAYQAAILQKIYGQLTNESRICTVVLKYTQRNIEQHQLLLQDWWQTKLEQAAANTSTINTPFA